MRREEVVVVISRYFREQKDAEALLAPDRPSPAESARTGVTLHAIIVIGRVMWLDSVPEDVRVQHLPWKSATPPPHHIISATLSAMGLSLIHI